MSSIVRDAIKCSYEAKLNGIDVNDQGFQEFVRSFLSEKYKKEFDINDPLVFEVMDDAIMFDPDDDIDSYHRYTQRELQEHDKPIRKPIMSRDKPRFTARGRGRPSKSEITIYRLNQK